MIPGQVMPNSVRVLLAAALLELSTLELNGGVKGKLLPNEAPPSSCILCACEIVWLKGELGAALFVGSNEGQSFD